jgi:hypothetical protein
MIRRRKLRRALEMLTRGGDARVHRHHRARAAEAADRAAPWLTGPGVQAIGIAKRVSGNRILPDLTIKVYVERKLPIAECEAPVPSHLSLPGIDEAVRTDVEAIGRVRLHVNTARVRPAVPGFSVGHAKVSYGTLGCVVTRPDSPDPFILSCCHVLAASGVATIGDAITQPGVFDQAGPGDFRIGTLAAFVPLDSGAGYPNRVDAAIARLDGPELVEAAIRFIGVPRGVSEFVREGMPVQKTGRTTDYTMGIVKCVDTQIRLDYEIGQLGFRDVVMCTRYASDGDSGAAVLNRDGYLLGLHFAGSESVSLFCRFGYIRSLLGVEPVVQA